MKDIFIPAPLPKAAICDELLQREYPYGVFRCADGSEVLFNRAYHPIWKRAKPTRKAVRCDPYQVTNITSQVYFTQGIGAMHVEEYQLNVLRLALQAFKDGEPIDVFVVDY